MGVDYIAENDTGAQKAAENFVTVLQEIQEPLINSAQEALVETGVEAATEVAAEAISSAVTTAKEMTLFSNGLDPRVDTVSEETIESISSTNPKIVANVVAAAITGKGQVKTIEEIGEEGVAIISQKRFPREINGVCTKSETTWRIEFATAIDGVFNLLERFHSGNSWEPACDEGVFLDEWRVALGEMGVLGAPLKGYGCPGLSYVAYGLICQELERGDSGLRSFASVQWSLAMYPIWDFGSEEQKNYYLPKLTTGEWIGCFGLTEPDYGSNPGDMITKAEDMGDHYLLNGAKMWITNGPDADVLIVYMRTAPKDQGSKAMTAFIIEKSMKGFSTSKKLDKLGMRGSNTCELVFEDCELPHENVILEVNHGVKVLMSGLNFERVVLSGGPIGIMQAAMDLVLPYLHERKQSDRPIGTFELMQAKIADMYTSLQSSRAYCYRVAQNCVKGQVSRIQTSSCLLFASENAVKVSLEAIQALGGNGYINDYPAGRLLRDAKLYDIGAGTNEIRRMLIGREVFDNSFIN